MAGESTPAPLPHVVIPFHWRAFFRKYGYLLRDEGRPFAVAGQMAFRMALLGFGQSAWVYDALRHSKWKDAEMRGPLFIVGHQRSGTTLLHRTLAADRTHARALALHEMVLPAVSFQRALASWHAWDQRHGGKAQRRFDAIQERLLGPLDHIHRVRFNEIEEDEFVLWTVFRSGMCANDAPASAGQRALDFLRRFDEWPQRDQDSALGWYRACLLKKVYREPAINGEGPPWIVSKNPAFSQKIPALLRAFPDARFIHLVRDPLVTIPSRLSLIRAIWRQRFPGVKEMTPEQVETIVEDSIRTYTYAHRDLRALPEDRWIEITYEDLTADLPRSVHQIYERFSLPAPDTNLNAELAARAQRQRAHTSEHEYSLEEFGLDEAELSAVLQEVREFHD